MWNAMFFHRDVKNFWYCISILHGIPCKKNYRSLVQKSPIKETVFCKVSWCYIGVLISHGVAQLVGSFNIYVSFAEYRLFYRALLHKRPIILRSLRIVAPLYHTTISRGQICTFPFFEKCEIDLIKFSRKILREVLMRSLPYTDKFVWFLHFSLGMQHCGNWVRHSQFCNLRVYSILT